MSNIDKYITQICKLCRRIAKKDENSLKQLEEMTIEDKYPKIISDLAENMSLMIFKVQVREHQLEEALAYLQETKEELEKAHALLKEKNLTLRGQIHHLKIDIDKATKARDISIITHSKFFKSIKKAKKHLKK